jgi:hypothetical protein
MGSVIKGETQHYVRIPDLNSSSHKSAHISEKAVFEVYY